MRGGSIPALDCLRNLQMKGDCTVKKRCSPKLGVVVLVALALLAGCDAVSAQPQFERSLVAALHEIYSEDSGDARYFLRWLDLNGDGVSEAIVHVVGSLVCGTGGCDTHIFARRRGSYELVSTIGLSRPLVVASPRRSRKWRNLIVYVAGGGVLPGHYVELKYDGRSYPENPTVEPVKRVRGRPRGMVLIKPYTVYTQGKPLLPKRRQSNNGMHPTQAGVSVIRQPECLFSCARAGDAGR